MTYYPASLVTDFAAILLVGLGGLAVMVGLAWAANKALDTGRARRAWQLIAALFVTTLAVGGAVAALPGPWAL